MAEACRALDLQRSTYYRNSTVSAERQKMEGRIIDLSEEHPRYGYRRVTVLARREGALINAKRVQRVRRQHGLQVRKKQRKLRRTGLSTAQRQRADHPNHVWSWDFVEDQTENGTRFRILTLIDEYTRECLAMHIAWSIRAVDVIATLEAAIALYGAPEHIRSDNGPEFIAYAIQDWLQENEIKAIYIEPGAPWEAPSLRRGSASVGSSSIGGSRRASDPCRLESGRRPRENADCGNHPALRLAGR